MQLVHVALQLDPQKLVVQLPEHEAPQEVEHAAQQLVLHDFKQFEVQVAIQIV